MIELRRCRNSRYPGKPVFAVALVDGQHRSWIGEVQQVLKTGEWFYNPDGQRRHTTPYPDRDAAVLALVAAMVARRRRNHEAAEHAYRHAAAAAEGPIVEQPY